MNAAEMLRQRLKAGGIIAAPGAPDSLTARLIEQAGFEAIYMTGFGATASRLGRPDIGLLTQTEMTTHARDMARAVTIPIIADADTGYGGPANIARSIEEYAQAGVAAIHLEDQVAPKRCGQLAGLRIKPGLPELFCLR
jgi:2-methylisocitrate lyase-like PEP mutase family enzyme